MLPPLFGFFLLLCRERWENNAKWPGTETGFYYENIRLADGRGLFLSPFVFPSTSMLRVLFLLFFHLVFCFLGHNGGPEARRKTCVLWRLKDNVLKRTDSFGGTVILLIISESLYDVVTAIHLLHST